MLSEQGRPSQHQAGRETTGFPSPAEIWREHPLSLDELLVAHPEATFFVTMRGGSMREAGIFDQDLLIVDRALPATHQSIILAQVNAGLVVRRLYRIGEQIILHSAHPRYPPIEVRPEMGFEVWGVVLFAIHPLHPYARQRSVPLSWQERGNRP